MKFRLIIVLSLVSLAAVKAQVVNVDPYTGQATTTIPLWTLKSGSLSYPIMLYNVSGGIKADAYGGPVGAGWNITSGTISRTVRGLPDDYNGTDSPAKQGWLVNNTAAVVGGFVPSADDNLADYTDEQADFAFLNSLGGFSATTTIRDTEPDMYTINTPGLSGSFTFDNSGALKFLTKNDYKVTYTKDEAGGIVSFIIVDEGGTMYAFGQPSKLTVGVSGSEALVNYFKYKYNIHKSSVAYYAKWSLVSIETVNGDRITFEYSTPRPFIDVNGHTYVTLIGSSQKDSVYASIFNQVISGEHRNALQYVVIANGLIEPQFSKAVGKSERVEVVSSTVTFPAGDYATMNQPVVGEISIYGEPKDSQDVLLKKFKLDYDVVVDINEAENHYPMLRSITEMSTVLSKPPYRFTYYGVTSAKRTTLGRNDLRIEDEYGYLSKNVSRSGSDNEPSGAVFKTHIYPDLTGADRIRNKPLISYTSKHYETGEVASDDIDFAGLMALSLSEVELPTGGVNRIYYEPRYYRDGSAQQDYYGGGLRVSQLEYHDGVDPTKDIVTQYAYVEDDGTSSGVLLSKPLRAFTANAYTDLQTGTATYYGELLDQNLPEEEIAKKTTVIANGEELNEEFDQCIQIGYRKVAISQSGTGKTVFTYEVPAAFGVISEGDWTATRTRIARQTPPFDTSVTPHLVAPLLGYYTYPFAPNPNYDFRRGLLKKREIYDNADNLVEQIEYEYTFLSNASKVYALRLDQTNAQMTGTITVNGPDGPVHLVRTLTVPMYVYSRYEVNVDAGSRPLKTTSRIFNQGNSSIYRSVVTDYEYGSTMHDLPTVVRETASNGIEYATNYKYPSDYIVTGEWAQLDNATKAVEKLKSRNVIRPVESWVTKKEGSEIPSVVSANLLLFEYDPATEHLYGKKQYTLSTGDPLTNFAPSSVVNSAGSSIFTFDTRYNRHAEQLHQDGYGNARSILSYNKERSSVHTYTKNGVVQIAINNALADQVVFSDFEAPTGYDFASTGNAVVAGRTSGSGLNLLSGSARKLSASLSKGEGSAYVFSCWIKSASSGTLTIRVLDGTHTPVISLIGFTNTSGAWKYYSTRLPVAILNTTMTVEAETSASVNIDDVLFSPATAAVNYYLYGPGFLKVAETDVRGVTAFYDYDHLGRLLYVRDQDRNILKSYSYPYVPKFESISIFVHTDATGIYPNVPTNFWISPNYTGAAYKVKIVSRESHETNPEATRNFSTGTVLTLSSAFFTHTFCTTGTWIVNTQITYQGTTLTTEYFYTVKVQSHPLTLNICGNRPRRIDLCNPVPFVSGCVADSPGLTLKATAANGTAPYTYTWYYETYPIGTGATLNIPSYEFNRTYRCRVTDAIGRGGQADYEITTYRSNPNCPPVPSEN